MAEKLANARIEGFPEIPQDFLGLNPDLLAQSVARIRGTADLETGLDALAADFYAVSSLDAALSTGEPWDSRLRDIRRGGILAYQLAQESSGMSPITASEALADMATMHSPEVRTNSDRQQALNTARIRMLKQNMWLRQTAAIPEEDRRPTDPTRGVFAEGDTDKQARYESELSTMVDAVLDGAGLGSSFDEAVGNLRGAGLEADPTDLATARFGAAITILGINVQQPPAL